MTLKGFSLSVQFISMPSKEKCYTCGCCKQKGHKRHQCQVLELLSDAGVDELCPRCTRVMAENKNCVSTSQGGCQRWSEISAVLLVDNSLARALWSAFSQAIAMTFPLFRIRYGIENCNGIDYTRRLWQLRADHAQNSMTSIERLCDAVALPNGKCPVGLCSFHAFFGFPVTLRDVVAAQCVFHTSWADVSYFPYKNASKSIRLAPVWIQEADEEPQLLFCARHGPRMKQQKPVLMPPPRLPDAKCIAPAVTITAASVCPKLAIAGRKRYNSHSWNMLFMVRSVFFLYQIHVSGRECHRFFYNCD